MPEQRKPEDEILLERVFDVFELLGPLGSQAKRDKKGRPVRTGEEVVLRLFRPVYGDDAKFGDNTWVCRFCIGGPEIAIERRLPGTDSLQAVMSAIMLAEKDLHDLGERIGHLGRPGFSSMPVLAHPCDRDHRDILWHLHNAEQTRYNRLHQLKLTMREAGRRAARRK